MKRLLKSSGSWKWKPLKQYLRLRLFNSAMCFKMLSNVGNYVWKPTEGTSNIFYKFCLVSYFFVNFKYSFWILICVLNGLLCINNILIGYQWMLLVLVHCWMLQSGIFPRATGIHHFTLFPEWPNTTDSRRCIGIRPALSSPNFEFYPLLNCENNV